MNKWAKGEFEAAFTELGQSAYCENEDCGEEPDVRCNKCGIKLCWSHAYTAKHDDCDVAPATESEAGRG